MSDLTELLFNFTHLLTIGLRNVIAHRYEQVQQDRIWAIVTAELNTLLVQLEQLLPTEK